MKDGRKIKLENPYLAKTRKIFNNAYNVERTKLLKLLKRKYTNEIKS